MASKSDLYKDGESVDRAEMIRVQGLRRCQHRRDRHAVTLTLGHQLITGPISEHRTDQCAEFVECRDPGGKRVEPGILELLRLTEPGP